MGMESIELIMEVEDEFGIKVSNSEAEKTITVEQFVDLVYSLLPEENKQFTAEDQICPSHKGFNFVRKALMEQAGVERAAIKPDTLLEDIVPRENRIKIWEKVREALGIHSFLYSGLEATNEIIGTNEMHSFRLYMPEMRRTEFSARCKKVKDLIWQICKANRKRTYSKNNISKKDIFSAVKYMILDIGCNLTYEEITPESRFVEDLGFG